MMSLKDILISRRGGLAARTKPGFFAVLPVPKLKKILKNLRLLKCKCTF